MACVFCDVAGGRSPGVAARLRRIGAWSPIRPSRGDQSAVRDEAGAPPPREERPNPPLAGVRYPFATFATARLNPGAERSRLARVPLKGIEALRTALSLYRSGALQESELYPYLYPHAFAPIVESEARARRRPWPHPPDSTQTRRIAPGLSSVKGHTRKSPTRLVSQPSRLSIDSGRLT